jgi:hypothetical protein
LDHIAIIVSLLPILVLVYPNKYLISDDAIINLAPVVTPEMIGRSNMSAVKMFHNLLTETSIIKTPTNMAGWIAS